MPDQDPRVPPHRTCGAAEVHHRLLESRTYQANRMRIESFTERFRVSEVVGKIGTVTIPVVVHIVYGSDVQNISDTQIQSQIDVLNSDYQGVNPDRAKIPAVWAALAANANVRFSLATLDPQGGPSNGITRTQTGVSSFTTDDAVKASATGGADAWPSDKYLNIWVCNLGGGLLGYAQFPGGPPQTDGVVILFTAFGTTGTAAAPFNLGRTATHEIGHWLNLIHIWGDRLDCSGTDLVDDTPTQQAPNYNKPTFPHVSCSNGPNGDMFMNYMDYVDDDSMVMFTQGQIVRVRAALDGPRSSIGS
jgi:hypothetical protein